MARSRRKLSFPPVENKVTDEGNIILCTLCSAPHAQLSAPTSWKNAQAQDVAISLHLTLQSPVCRPCRDNIGRLVKNPAVIPRWEKEGRMSNCCIPMCTNASFSTSKFATSEQIAHILMCEKVPYPAPLCKNHYHLVYDTLQSKQTHCCTCNSSLRNIRKRTCPDPKIIQQYLEQNTGFEGTIPDDGRVCASCYKAQLVICKTGCHSRQCGCKGKGKLCGEGCNCINCTNTGTQTMQLH